MNNEELKDAAQAIRDARKPYLQQYLSKTAEELIEEAKARSEKKVVMLLSEGNVRLQNGSFVAPEKL